jgi:hypothetical protein
MHLAGSLPDSKWYQMRKLIMINELLVQDLGDVKNMEAGSGKRLLWELFSEGFLTPRPL